MSNYATRAALIAGAKKLKDFDLHEGEVVRTQDEFGRRSYYKVTGIYPHIFTVENIDNGLRTAFCKADALTGMVRRCR